MSPSVDDIGRTLLLVGVLLAVIGGVLLLVGAVPGLGRLPGDISIERDGFRFYAPLATSLLVSLVLVVNLLARR